MLPNVDLFILTEAMSSKYHFKEINMFNRIIPIMIGLVLFMGSGLQAQLSEPTNMMVMDKYIGADAAGTSASVFREYFMMLQGRYEGESSPASAWGIYYESPSVMYRLAAVPEAGMEGVLELQQDRVASANAFGTSEQALFGAAWQGRRTSVWAELGSLNYMPDNWDYQTVSGNPYHSVRVYYVNQGEQQDFEMAIDRMNELNRSVGINDLMTRVFRGGLGTMAPVYMLRSSSEDMEDHGRKITAHRAARESILAEWQENNRRMVAMSRHIDQMSNYRMDSLSRAPGDR